MLYLVLFLTSLFSYPCYAANYAIRTGCANSGDGTTWNCAAAPVGVGAYNTIPAALARGDTYYFSKGTLTLSVYPLDDTNSGTTYITFKKATDSDYGGLSGWSSSLGESQTVFMGSTGSHLHYNIIWKITNANCGYYKWDGVYGKGPNAGDYGFKFEMGNKNPPWDCFLVYGNQNPTGLEFYHVAFQGIPQWIEHDQRATWEGWILGKFQYCLFDWMSNAIHGFTDDLIVDHCYFTNCWGRGPTRVHGQQISYNGNRLTLRNSFFKSADPWGDHSWTRRTGDLDMTAFVSFNDARNPGFGADGWMVYNNIFVNPRGGNGVLTNSSSGGTGITNMAFYHNTIFGDSRNIRNNGILHITFASGCRGNIVRNNLWYNVNVAIGASKYEGSIIHDYNYWNSTCINKPREAHGIEEGLSAIKLFVDPNNDNYRLKGGNSAIDKGVALHSPYNIDRDGVTRPQGSGWDMGACEYSGIGTGGSG